MRKRVLERVKDGLTIKGRLTGYTKYVEMQSARGFLEGVLAELGGYRESYGLEVLVQEALMVYVLSNRLSKEAGVLGREKRMRKDKSVAYVEEARLARTIERWLRMQARLGRLLRELTARYGVESRGGEESMAQCMGVMLAMGEGVLDDVVEFTKA